MTNGLQSDDIASQIERLEAALERIAVLVAEAADAQAAAQAERALQVHAEPAGPIPETVVTDTVIVTARLDSMIARLRAAVEE